MSNPIDAPAVSTSETPELRLQPRAVATRATILAEAARVFDASGYSAASINDVIALGGLTKGALFYHFPSKEAIAQQLVHGWSLAVATAFSEAATTGESVTRQLREVFLDLARKIEGDLHLRAGMKLTFESGVDGAHQVYRQWVDDVLSGCDRLAAEECLNFGAAVGVADDDQSPVTS